MKYFMLAAFLMACGDKEQDSAAEEAELSVEEAE